MPPRRVISGPARLALETKGVIRAGDRPVVQPVRRKCRRRRNPPPPAAPKLTPEQRAEIRRRQFEPQKVLAHEFGVSKHTISLIQDRPHAAQKLTPEQVAEIKQRIEARMESLAGIGREYGVTTRQVWNIKHGLVGYAR